MPKKPEKRQVRRVLDLSDRIKSRPLSDGLQTQFETFRMLSRRHHEVLIEYPFLKPKP